jgi:hypothetical protein
MRETTPLAVEVNPKLQIEALRRFIVECDHLRELEQIIGRFNIFDVLKSSNNEIRHSNVLAWLLDPKGSHALRDLFLRRWLMRVYHEAESDHPSSIDPVAIDTAPFRSVFVRREWHNIDLLIEIETMVGQKWVICVENKVWSWQGVGQLAKYRERVEGAFPKSSKKSYILLSVRGEKPEDEPYLVGSYSQIADVLQRCLAECGASTGEAQKLLISHYHSILTSYFMPDSEVIQLANQIYSAHREAIDLIIEHKPDILQKLTAAIEEKMISEAKTLGIQPKWTTKGLVRFLPKSWDIQKNRVNDGWSTVICEIYLWSGKVVFKIFAGPEAPHDWKKQLFNCARKSEFPTTIKRKVVSEQWYTFYSVRGPDLKFGELLPEEVDAKAEDIWKFVKSEVQSVRFKKMVPSVAKMLSSLPEAEK